MFSKKKKEQDEILNTIDNMEADGSDLEGNDDASYEMDDPDAAAAPKKKLPAWIIIPIIAVLGIGIFAVSRLSASNTTAKGTSLKVTAVKTSNVKEVYNASGKIESENTKTYYSPVTAPISRCNIAVGDTVKAGDLLITFDTANLERDNQKAQLSLQTSRNTTKATYEKNAKAIDSANAASQQAVDQANSLADKVNALGAQVDAAYAKYEAELQAAKDAEPEQQSIKKSISELQTVIDQNQAIISETEVNYAGRRADLDTANNKETKDANDQATIDALQPIFERYDKAVVAVKDSNKKIDELKTQLRADVSDAEYTGLKSQYDALYAQWEAAYNTAMSAPAADVGMSAAEAANLEISDNLAELSALTPAELVAKGKEGMKADMNGVVSAVEVLQTNAATQGMSVFTIATTDNVRLKIEVSPDDYDKLKIGTEATITVGQFKYKGKLTKINKIAIKNEKGNPVIGAQIHIENPDDNLCIGATAKMTMTVAEAKNVLTVPTEVINTSSEGEFVYIIKDGIVQKKPVELGTSSTTSIEIKSGLEEGDQVVNDLNVDITEGMKATPLTTDTKTDTATDKK